MQTSSSTRNSDVIVLSDSDNEDPNFVLPAAGVSIMISAERPLDLGLFMPSTSDYDTINSPVLCCSDAKIGTLRNTNNEVKAKNIEISQKSNYVMKAHSNSINIRPPLKASSHSSVHHELIDYCCESYDPNAPAFDATQISNSFKCTVGTCKRILPNNVSYMFHLWSHLVSFRPFGLESPLSEIEKLCMCPQCLSIFPSPNRLHQHYTDAHGQNISSSTCLICEIVVDKEQHLIHDGPDAPYHCKKCRYRTSVRVHFLDHFVRFHSSTSALLCPFCLLTFNISRIRDRKIVVDRHYTTHLFSHLKGKHFKCEQCVLKFLNKAEKLSHKKDHAKLNPRWDKKVYAKRSRRKGLRLWPQKNVSYCFECYEVPGDSEEHWKQSYFCSCCNYRTNCYNAFQHHKYVGCSTPRLGITRRRIIGGLLPSPSCFCEASCANSSNISPIKFSGLDSAFKPDDGLIDFKDYSEDDEADLFGIKKKLRVTAPLFPPARLKTTLLCENEELHNKMCSILDFAKRQLITAVAEEEPSWFIELLKNDSF